MDSDKYYVVSHDARGILRSIAQEQRPGEIGKRGSWHHGNFEKDSMRFPSLERAKDAIASLRDREQWEVGVKESGNWWTNVFTVPYGTSIQDIYTLDEELVRGYARRLLQQLESLAEEAEYHVQPSSLDLARRPNRVDHARTKIFDVFNYYRLHGIG